MLLKPKFLVLYLPKMLYLMLTKLKQKRLNPLSDLWSILWSLVALCRTHHNQTLLFVLKRITEKQPRVKLEVGGATAVTWAPMRPISGPLRYRGSGRVQTRFLFYNVLCFGCNQTKSNKKILPCLLYQEMFQCQMSPRSKKSGLSFKSAQI